MQKGICVELTEKSPYGIPRGAYLMEIQHVPLTNRSVY